MKVLGKFCLFSLILFGIILCNCSFASDWNLPWVKIISRAQWWADESIRLRSTPRPSNSDTWNQTEAQKKSAEISRIRNERMAKNFPNEWKYEWSNTMFWKYYLIYPEYFNHHKNKIIIHHTANNYDPNWTIDDVKKEIQSIYRYHTINRNFGDIWYNFLIDQMWNIYEWRAWWEWAVWMHASSNNITSIWISLMGNFENSVPTEAQLGALINLTTAIAKYYNIDPNWYTYTFSINTSKEPYVTSRKNPNIMWHEDTKATACPGKNLYKFLPLLRKEVAFRLENWIVWDTPLPSNWIKELNSMWSSASKSAKSTASTSKSTNFANQLMSILEKNPNALDKTINKLRNNYKWKLPKASNMISKITKKYTVNEVKDLLNQNISVLLYELTTKYDSFEIVCDMSCIFNIDGMNYTRTGATLTFLTNKIQVKSDRNLSANNVIVRSSLSNWIVKISNYNRKSYVWIPWNKFKGYLRFEKWSYPMKDWTFKSDLIVINTLPFTEYMKWIVETNDTETLEKNKVMAMIAKNYALFYLKWENNHPSIPNNAGYTAIDDPDFFQKYVWAWLEQTLTKRYKALNETKDKIVMYDDYLPILPYFSCSAGFTLSAQEKRWWIDTPYLKSVYDFDACDDFAGHWVWLSGKWAERLAKKWMNYEQILKYYYKGIKIAQIN